MFLHSTFGVSRVLREGPNGGALRLSSYPLFIATGSYFSIRARVAKILPEPFTTAPMRPLPILLLFGAMFYWLWRSAADARCQCSSDTIPCHRYSREFLRSGVLSRIALVIVQPETVICWHRTGFRFFWALAFAVSATGTTQD